MLPERAATWLALAYTVVIGSGVVFVLYVVVIRLWSASRAAYGFVITPVVTVLLSAWLDDEPITAGLVVGGALVLVGVYVGALRPHRSPRHRPRCRNNRAASRPPAHRRDRIDPEQLPLARNALQLVRAARLELDPSRRRGPSRCARRALLPARHAQQRGRLCTAIPAILPPAISHFGVQPDFLASRLRSRTPSAIAQPQRTARAGPSKLAKKPSPAVSTSRPRKRSSCRRTREWCRSSIAAASPGRLLGGALGRAYDVAEQHRGKDAVRLRLLPGSRLPDLGQEAPHLGLHLLRILREVEVGAAGDLDELGARDAPAIQRASGGTTPSAVPWTISVGMRIAGSTGRTSISLFIATSASSAPGWRTTGSSPRSRAGPPRSTAPGCACSPPRPRPEDPELPLKVAARRHAGSHG